MNGVVLYACRDCGSECCSSTFEANNGICNTCRWTSRAKRKRFIPIFVNGVECVTEGEARRAIAGYSTPRIAVA